MKLDEGQLRPGWVVEVLENGQIKANVPGLFTDADGTEVMPPIYPFPVGHANSFSCPKVGEEVWVLNFSDNKRQLHWFRKDNFEENNSDFPIGEEGENVEIIVNRNYGDDENPTWATIYFSNGDGWVIREGKDSIINIRNDGSILLNSGKDKRVIDICDDSISLGVEGGAEDNAMLFSKWKQWLQTDLCDNLLSNFVTALVGNPYTAPAGAALQELIPNLRNSGDDIKSNHVTITEN